MTNFWALHRRQTPVLPVIASIHTYDFCTSQFHSLSFTQLSLMAPFLLYLRLNFVNFPHLYHISHASNRAVLNTLRLLVEMCLL